MANNNNNIMNGILHNNSPTMDTIVLKEANQLLSPNLVPLRATVIHNVTLRKKKIFF